jgi:hypothetical protein
MVLSFTTTVEEEMKCLAVYLIITGLVVLFHHFIKVNFGHED